MASKKTLKKRLDLVLVEKGLIPSRHRAKAMIMAGKVLINNTVVDKPGSLVDPLSSILVKQDDNPYVSRGGLKLVNAL